MSKKDNGWIKKRHAVITSILKIFLRPYMEIKYGVKVERFKEQGKRKYMILYNHQTSFDQFFVAEAFKGAVYYVATEDIFSMGWISDLIRWLVAPIPIRKQTTDIQAVKNCIRVAREGGSIAIAPEGNRTYSGKLCYMNPAIASLVKKVGLPIALFKIEGGYGVQPRWSDVKRKGRMTARVAKVIEPEEYKQLTNEELMEMLYEELSVDESCINGEFRHQKTAEYLERAIYVCPHCGLSTFESHNDIIMCKKCRMEVKYRTNRQLKGVNEEFPFEFISDWYEYQENYINGLDMNNFTDVPMYVEEADLSEVIVYEKKIPVFDNAEVSLFGNRIIIKTDEFIEFNFDEVRGITVLGKNKINIYLNNDNKIYQLKGDKRFNGLKYVNIFYRYKNQMKGENHVEFLGL